MYINKIDDLIDKIIDDFSIAMRDNKQYNIFISQNFVKYQKNINDMFMDYIKTINIGEINELVKNADNVGTILNIIKRYIAFYFFLTIGANYTWKNDIFINNIVEFSKNQPAYPFKVVNFFNSENNALLIKYNDLVKNIMTLLSLEGSALSNTAAKPEYKEAVSFLNKLGSEYIDVAFKTGTKNDQIHNIIKTIIILLIYKRGEKDEVFRILEMIENEDSEYTFIDVVVPKTTRIDFASIEALLSEKDIVRGLAHEFWGYLTEYKNNIKLVDITVEEKILNLINSRIIVPIVDDFLLYHKDTERYDKHSNDPTKNLKKNKEDTKIRYIVNKIDRASDLYSDAAKKDPKVKADIKKLFNVPLADRKAVLYNHNEDVKIINKLLNQGKGTIENNEYYNDLLYYKKYPYINFKDFQHNGFSLTLTETVTLIRSISLDPETPQNDKNIIQLRVGSKDQTINIVGFAIVTNKSRINCLKLRDFSDITTLEEKKKNGYELMENFIQETQLNTKLHKSSVYWLFDLENDVVNMDTYEQIDKLGFQEQLRYMISKLYDSVVDEIFYEVRTKIAKYKHISLHNALKIIEKYEDRYKFPKNTPLFDDLEGYIYDNIIKVEPAYDENDDKFFGLSKDAIKLEKVEQDTSDKIQTVRIDVIKAVSKEEEDQDVIIGVCQHNISWDNIAYLRKTNPNTYSELLYDFIEQYVIENQDGDFICKSCGHQLNIKKYVLDGTFDDDSQKFIAFATPLDIPLEEVPEYRKYNIVIRNIDKIIEKIANITGIPYMNGTSYAVKSKRKNITKDAIDLVIMNNIKLKKNFKERNIEASKLYGVNRELSNLFIFELDNSIFVYSSKEKDFYKHIKYNNIIAYLILLIILELNDNHISFLFGNSKSTCNYTIFEKFGHSLFDGLKVRRNIQGDTIDIKRYKTLCYILYIVTCFITRYGIWHQFINKTDTKDTNTDTGSDTSDDHNTKPKIDLKKLKQSTATKKKSFDPRIQKTIIHTVVDVLNSILEIGSSQSNNQRLYNIFQTKYFMKLQTMFMNEDLLNPFKMDQSSSIANERKDYVMGKMSAIPLPGYYIPQLLDDPHYNKCKNARFVPKSRKPTLDDLPHIDNTTNCLSGDFHDWITGSGPIKCKLCNVLITVKYNEEDTKIIHKNIKYIALQKLAEKYCNDGTLHNYVFADEDACNVCVKCKVSENFKFSHEELDIIEKKVNENHQREREENKQIIESITKKYEEEEKVSNELFNKLLDHFKRDSTVEHPYKFIDQFINNIRGIIGDDTGKDSNTLLQDNVYIIDHDQFGYKLDNPIVIIDKDNRIFYKSNHPVFKTDVIYYTSHRNGKTDVFYDAITHILLGYKENSRDYIIDKKSDRKIKINLSVANKLKILGYKTQIVNIKQLLDDEMINNPNDSYEDIMRNILTNIIRERIHNLKKIVVEFQRYIYRFRSTPLNITKETTSKEYNEEKDEETKLYEKYNKKLYQINTESDNGKHQLFKNWSEITNSIFVDNLEEKNINFKNVNLLNVDEITKYGVNSNMLLYYIISEIDKLFHFNAENKFMRINIVGFVIDFITYVFSLFNTDDLMNIYDIKRFSYILQSESYVHDMDQKGHGLQSETTGIYDEYKEDDVQPTEEEGERIIDDEEEGDALDIDVDLENDAEEVQDYYPKIWD